MHLKPRLEKPEDETRTRFESVLLQMREMILNGDLPANSRVQEIAIGQRLGVSRTPVRLSLSVLELEGLVYGEPNRGFIVREFTTDDVQASYDVRAVLEGFACRIIASQGLSLEDEKALDACLEQGSELLEAGFFDASASRKWSAMNGRFHSILIIASKNRALTNALELINKHPLAAPTSIVFRTNNLQRLFVNMVQAQKEHGLVLEALKQGEPIRAEALMNEHIYQSKNIVLREIKEKGTTIPEFFRTLKQP
jgi:GntR family transcriptional regulator of vanillate catabolism